MPRPPAPCGSETAYRRHLRDEKRGGPGPCPACREAHRAHVGERRDRAKREKTAQLPEDLTPTPSAGDDRPAPSSSTSTRLDDLRSMRDTLREAIRAQAMRDTSKLAPLSKELREVLREIESVEADQGEGADDGFDAFFAAGGDLGNVSRFPAPADRQVS